MEVVISTICLNTRQIKEQNYCIHYKEGRKKVLEPNMDPYLDPKLDPNLEKKNTVIVSMLLFTKNNNHTSSTGVSVNKTFCDSSSRTESLRRRTDSTLKDKYKVKPFDVNELRHKLQSIRNSGGIPKKCSHSPL
jgi:hypothetical protein